MRRDFLKLCSLSGLGLAAPVGLTSSGRAQTGDQGPYEGPYYVVFNASGGWDTTYLMDPKSEEAINRLNQQADIETKGPHRFAPTAAHIDAGISNENFFAKYGDELLVFNGLDYSVNNHSPCSRYMATGKLDSLAYPTFAALVAACKGPQCPLAFLTFGNYSATGNLVAMARIPYLPTLKLIARADHVEGGSHQYHDDFMSDRIEQALSDQRDAREKTPRLPRAARAQSMLYSAQLNSKSLERVTPHIPSQVPKERLARQAEITLASFKAGVCVSANLNIGQFDSHANNDRDQMKLIPEFLAGIDYLVSRAEELGIRDQLVVVIQSEMGRTPNYNKGDGKDHWSIGSIMFLGQGIQGRRVIGETDDGQFLKPIDPQTLGVDPQAGIHVRPEHIHQALREHAGISEHPFSKQFPLDVADKGEELQGFWGG
jgi:uncharacterized protein (DUF1501 family)